MKRLLKMLIYPVIVLIVVFAIFLIYSTIADYKPEEKIVVYESKKPDIINDTLELSFMIWNIGYCGLNAEMDYFYEGGKKVRPDKGTVVENIKGINNYLRENSNIDFVLLQEVDIDSKRSRHYNLFDSIAGIYPEYSTVFGKNYDVFYVPQPITNPMGKVNSGLMTVSKYNPSESVRYSFPGNYSWPMSLFFLDRCFLVNRYPIANEKELIVINTHNSAYDNGSLKEQQMNYLKTFLENEYKKANYIIVGGDWNQCPPNYNADFKQDIQDNNLRSDINKNFMPKWKWLFDNKLPTNRRVNTPYRKGVSLTTVIDFYLVSPNIDVVNVKNIDLGFKYSDHNPVKVTIKLK